MLLHQPLHENVEGKRVSGFTLVELMIVLAIIGLMSGIVVLSIPDPRGRLIDAGERFAARVMVARDAAVVDGREVSLSIDPLGYRFEQRRRGDWQAFDQRELAKAEWGEGVGVAVGRESRGRIVIDTTGQVSEAVTVTLRRDGEQLPIAIGQDGVVRVGR